MGAEVKLDARGVWYAQPYLGTAPDGRQIRPRRSFPAAGSRAEAQELADAWYAQLSADGRVKSALMVDLLWAYIEDRKAKGASPNTVKRWSLFTRTYVGRYLRGRVARELTVMELNDFERRLLAPKERGGQGLSRNSVVSVHHFLRGAYGWWVRAGICDSNPMLDVEKPAEHRHEAVAVDEWDYARLSDSIMDLFLVRDLSARSVRRAAYAFAAWLALHTGMRVGEVCALRRRDVNRRMGYVHVCGKVVELPGGGTERVDIPKSRKSRNVAMAASEFEMVRAWVELQDELSATFGPESPLVSADGGLMRPTTVSKAFARMRDAAGLPKSCTFHSLRHTHATWCLANGVDLKTLSERLGHANEATTLRLYAHCLPGRDAAAAEMFAAFAEELGRGV